MSAGLVMMSYPVIDRYEGVSKAIEVLQDLSPSSLIEKSYLPPNPPRRPVTEIDLLTAQFLNVASCAMVNDSSHPPRPYPFLGTVFMGLLLNQRIFGLSSLTHAIHCMTIGVLGSLGVNGIHKMLKFAARTNSNLCFVHILCVKPLSKKLERLACSFNTSGVIQDIVSGVFHHTGDQYCYEDGKRDVQLLIAGVITAIAIKTIFSWYEPFSLQTSWQTASTAAFIPALWTKSTQLSLDSDQINRPKKSPKDPSE